LADFDKVLKCIPKDSWFRDWMNLWPLAESPRSYIFFSGAAMLGVALGRKIYFSLDVHRVFPLLNLLLIGPSGIGKSTALRDIALKSLIYQIPEEDRPNVITGKSTKEALHQELMVYPHSIILASELANLFSKEKYNEGAIPYFTDLLDLEPVTIRTKSGGGAATINKPECAVMGGSTKAWLQDALPNNSGEGGFLPRFLIVKEDHKYQRIADPRRHMSDAQFRELQIERERVGYNFVRLLKTSDGIYDFEDYAASDIYSYWYQTYMPESGALAPFSARAGAHVLRLALLVAISRNADSISANDVEAGITLFRYTSDKLSEIIVPMTPEGKKINKLLEAIGALELDGASIRRTMRNHCSASDVDRMLADLTRDGELVYDGKKYRRSSISRSN
jgi:hypothetical protein